MMLRKLYQGIALSSSRKLSEGNSTDPDSRASSKAQVRAEQPRVMLTLIKKDTSPLMGAGLPL